LQQLQKVTAASESIRKADKFHKVIEVILAMGNAMNGTRRAPVYGFKLSSLDTVGLHPTPIPPHFHPPLFQLMILKSPKDRSITLMHAVAHQIQHKFPELLSFTEQLRFAESASAVSMETIGVDIRELGTKYDQTCAERDRKGREVESPLNEFLDKAAPQIESLRESWKLAQAAFLQCAEYYSEPVKTVQPDSFFSRFASFLKNFDQAIADNEAKAAAERVGGCIHNKYSTTKHPRVFRGKRRSRRGGPSGVEWGQTLQETR